ncbi:MAG TPA: PEP-CTERM sorting domain-containing protein [Candidatus Deferrimicrobiaceae bacterium]
MKRTRLTPLAVLAALLLCLSCAGAAQASAIVDTGPVSAGGTRVSDWTLNYTQWLGSEFTVDGPTTITGVQGFFNCSTAGTLLAVLHADGGTIPGETLFSREFSVTAGPGAVTSRIGYDYDWFGAGGLSWEVGPGSYWITFEAPAPCTYSGNMLGEALNPLELDAHYDWTPRAWFPGPDYESLDLGIRISGDAAPVTGAMPVAEPGTLLLLGGGLVGLAGCRRATRK